MCVHLLYKLIIVSRCFFLLSLLLLYDYEFKGISSIHMYI